MTANKQKYRTLAEFIADGEMGTCKECGRILGVVVPRHGDGTCRKMRHHKDTSNTRCPGSNRPCKEWDNERADSDTQQTSDPAQREPATGGGDGKAVGILRGAFRGRG